MLCTTERILNNSVKQPLVASPNTLLFGNSFSVDRTLLTKIDQNVAAVNPRSTQDFVDTLIARQTQIIDTAIHSQTSINEANMRKRYANYPRASKLWQRLETEADDNHRAVVSLVYFGSTRKPRPPIFAASKWIHVRNLFSVEQESIKKLHCEVETIDTIG